MSDQKTTISIGFKTETQALERASQRIANLKQHLKDMTNIGGGQRSGGVASGIPGAGIPGGLVRKGAAGGIAAFGALGIGIGVISTITKAVSSGKEYLQTLDPLSKQLSIVGHGQEEFARSLENTGEAIGRNRTEMLRLTQTYVQLAGQQDGVIARQMKTAGLLSKGMGVDAGLMASLMGSMAQMGAFGQYGGMRMDRFAALIADAVAKGGMKGREGELFSSIQSLMGTQLNVLTKLDRSATDSMLNMLTSMNSSGQPGLMGMRGAGLLNRLDAGFKNPQGEFGEYFMYNALGGGDYFDFKMRQEQGIFGKGNYSAVSNYLKKSFKDPQARWHAMNTLFGVSMHQAKALDSMDIEDSEAFLGELRMASGGDLSKIGADKFGLMAEIYNASSAKRAKLLKDSRIAGAAKKKGWNAQTDISEILQGIAQTNMQETETEQMLTQLANVENAIIELGRDMIPYMSSILEKVSGIAGKVIEKAQKDERTIPEKVADTFDIGATVAFPGYNAVKSTYQKGKEFFTGNGQEGSQAGKEIGSEVARSISPLLIGVNETLEQMRQTFNSGIEVKVTDERTAGDGNAVKAGR